MAVQLTNPETDRLYTCTMEQDVRMLIPGVYKGYISAAPPQAAEALIAQEHPAFVRKEGVSAEETAQLLAERDFSGLSMCDRD